jgi:hypothetical protein
MVMRFSFVLGRTFNPFETWRVRWSMGGLFISLIWDIMGSQQL